ncbi:hypothetical protein ASA1KI_45660 [Opitutales bacterium ASA1]|uniref:hypothetical protein n=1 Tax=Congregicoccus parvus TaxID=3081749 RepID=UPI002B2A807A|nr:hypothetical protein ASA1KI_45660 [Opitutales bacterium ASA1]
MIEALIGWLDAERWRYWAVGLLVTILWLSTVVAPWRRATTDPRADSLRLQWLDTAVWAFASFVLLLAWRWPFLVGPHILNPDESQMIAGAITLKQFPVFWKYVDGTTHGPLAPFALLFGNVFGIPLNYGGARLMGGILVVGGLVCAGIGFHRLYGRRTVRLALAAPVFLCSSISYYDFTGYTSESVPVFLILAACGLLVSALSASPPSDVRTLIKLGAAGTCLGAIPFAKLQGIPIGATIGALGCLTLVAVRRSWTTRSVSRAIGALVGGACVPTIVVAVYLWIWGLWAQFRITYIENNLIYAASPTHTPARFIAELWPFIHAAPGLQTLVVVTAAGVAAMFAARLLAPHRNGPCFCRTTDGDLLLCLRLNFVDRRTFRLMSCCLLLTIASIFAIGAPGRHFGHYLQFLLPPLTLLLLLAMGESARACRTRIAGPRLRIALSTALAVAMVAPLCRTRWARADPEMHGLWTRNAGEWRSPVGKVIASIGRPGDALAVWGWMPHFYVESGLPQATREAHTYGQIMEFPLKGFYRERYLRDFARSNPRLFVDAVGGDNFGFKVRADAAHETFPELAVIVARDYELLHDIDGTRIYLRRTPSP